MAALRRLGGFARAGIGGAVAADRIGNACLLGADGAVGRGQQPAATAPLGALLDGQAEQHETQRSDPSAACLARCERSLRTR